MTITMRYDTRRCSVCVIMCVVDQCTDILYCIILIYHCRVSQSNPECYTEVQTIVSHVQPLRTVLYIIKCYIMCRWFKAISVSFVRYSIAFSLGCNVVVLTMLYWVT